MLSWKLQFSQVNKVVATFNFSLINLRRVKLLIILIHIKVFLITLTCLFTPSNSYTELEKWPRNPPDIVSYKFSKFARHLENYSDKEIK